MSNRRKSLKKENKIFVIIVNYNRAKETVECLRSLDKLETGNWKLETIIVDNASSDNSVGLIRKKFPQVHLIVNKKNLGFAQGNNVGIKFALKKQADFIMLLNNDTLIDKRALVYLIKAARKYKKGSIFSPKIYFAPGFEYHKKRYTKKEKGKVIWYAGGFIDWGNVLGVHRGLDQVDKGQFEKEKETDFISGCCMFVKSQIFEKIGFLSEDYFLYLEDMDFCLRAKRVGFRLFFVPRAVVWHKNLGTNKKSIVDYQAYYYSRNRLLFGFKYSPWRTRLALVKESLRTLLKGNYWQKKGILDFYLGRFGKGSYVSPRHSEAKPKNLLDN